MVVARTGGEDEVVCLCPCLLEASRGLGRFEVARRSRHGLFARVTKVR